MKQKIINAIEQPKAILSLIKKVKPAAYFEILWARDISKKDFKTYIDAGCNEGSYIKAFKSLFPNARFIYAIDPIKDLCDSVAKKYGAVAFPIALWDKDENKCIFYINKRRSANSSLFEYSEHNIDYDNEIVKKIKVNKRRFDHLPIKIIEPCLLKIDVEGAEYEALKGFQNRLKEIDVIIIEKHLQRAHKGITSFGKIFDLLQDYGFYGFLQKSLRYKNGYPSKCNLIFYKPEI